MRIEEIKIMLEIPENEEDIKTLKEKYDSDIKIAVFTKLSSKFLTRLFKLMAENGGGIVPLDEEAKKLGGMDAGN